MTAAANLRGRGRGGDSSGAAGSTCQARRLIGAPAVRFVLDTNLLVSGVIALGCCAGCSMVKAGEFELCTSELLLAELLEVLSRSKFAARLAQAGLTPQRFVDDLRRIAVVASPTHTPRIVPTDPDDDHIIAAAVTGQADLIASGDKRDLLPCSASKASPSSPLFRPSRGSMQYERPDPGARPRCPSTQTTKSAARRPRPGAKGER
jgi:uncharacterized protein